MAFFVDSFLAYQIDRQAEWQQTDGWECNTDDNDSVDDDAGKLLQKGAANSELDYNEADNKTGSRRAGNKMALGNMWMMPTQLLKFASYVKVGSSKEIKHNAHFGRWCWARNYRILLEIQLGTHAKHQ